jgi:LPXTG-motif cell wall-anchored protein
VNVCGVGLLLAEGRGNCTSRAGDGNGGSSFGGGHAGRGGDAGDVNSFNNHGLLSGLQLLNNLDANIPVTVCGLAVLGAADCRVHVDAGNRNGGDSGHRGGFVGDRHHHQSHWTWHRHNHGSDHESSVLPHTGAAGMALLPFGLALIAGGAALRRRVASQR